MDPRRQSRRGPRPARTIDRTQAPGTAILERSGPRRQRSHRRRDRPAGTDIEKSRHTAPIRNRKQPCQPATRDRSNRCRTRHTCQSAKFPRSITGFRPFAARGGNSVRCEKNHRRAQASLIGRIVSRKTSGKGPTSQRPHHARREPTLGRRRSFQNPHRSAARTHAAPIPLGRPRACRRIERLRRIRRGNRLHDFVHRRTPGLAATRRILSTHRKPVAGKTARR